MYIYTDRKSLEKRKIGDGKKTYLHANSRLVLLLKLASGVPLHESGLASSSITNKNQLEVWNIIRHVHTSESLHIITNTHHHKTHAITPSQNVSTEPPVSHHKTPPPPDDTIAFTTALPTLSLLFSLFASLCASHAQRRISKDVIYI